MKVRVDPELCVGCGPCEEICPEVFQIVDDIAKVKKAEVSPELEEKVREAAQNCPNEAILIEE
jgi:ferredoxin